MERSTEELEMLRKQIAIMCSELATVEEIAARLTCTTRLVRELGVGLPLIRQATLEADARAWSARKLRSEQAMRHIDDEDAMHMREAFAGGMSAHDLAAHYSVTVVAVYFVLRGDLYWLAKGPMNKTLDVPPWAKYKKPTNEKHRRALKEKWTSCRHKYLHTLR